MVLGALLMPGRLVLPFLLLAVASGACDDAGQPPIDRRSFPKGFVFGTASAAYQVPQSTCLSSQLLIR
jgi:beta-glucosidase